MSPRSFEFHVKSRAKRVSAAGVGGGEASRRAGLREQAWDRKERREGTTMEKGEKATRARKREKEEGSGRRGRRRGSETDDVEREGDPLVTMVRVGPTTLRQPPLLVCHHPTRPSLLYPGSPSTLSSWFPFAPSPSLCELSLSSSLSLLARCKPAPSINITLFERTTARLSANRALSY